MTELANVAECAVAYTVDGVQFKVPVLLLPIIAGTAWERFSSERNFSGVFPRAACIGLALIDAPSMSTLWDALIPAIHFRRIPNLSHIIAQLDGHARSVEFFVAFILGLRCADMPEGDFTLKSLIQNVHARLEELSLTPELLTKAFDRSVEELMRRYPAFVDAKVELLAAVVTHCPVRMQTELDGCEVESFLNCTPITVTPGPRNLFYLSMPLSLLAAQAANLESALAKRISSVLQCQLDDQALRGDAFEEFYARHLALLLTASRLLPAALRRKRLSSHYPSALLLAGADKISLRATLGTAPITVQRCVAHFPKTLDMRNKLHAALVPVCVFIEVAIIASTQRQGCLEEVDSSDIWRRGK
jgi:hypothetical protein